uniref:Gamma-glutamylcyclotransferase a n=1 Tax=Neogobius melanostomus TaxID=47308 RepID=A0A8C6S305_9GOBI
STYRCTKYTIVNECPRGVWQALTCTFSNMSSDSEGRFLYFAFGSNLLKQRLQFENPSASLYITGRLKDYELKFGFWANNVKSRWHGAVATIEYCPGAEVWGVIWTMSNQHLSTLDEQEGVSRGMYSPLEVSVETEHGPVLCRTYKMNNFRPGLPSPQYKKVVCLGAEENGLPAEYLKKLNDIETNGYNGPSLLDELKLV